MEFNIALNWSDFSSATLYRPTVNRRPLLATPVPAPPATRGKDLPSQLHIFWKFFKCVHANIVIQSRNFSRYWRQFSSFFFQLIDMGKCVGNNHCPILEERHW